MTVAAIVLGLLALAGLAGCGSSTPKPTESGPATNTSPVEGIPEGWGSPDAWTLPATSQPDPSEFVSGVDNPYWPLVPGTTWLYEAQTEDGLETIEVRVLDETKTVAGVACVVVRDTVRLDGELIEDTYDWYAQDADGNVWYMGEDSKEYEDGKAVSTAGSWETGIDGALPGIKVWAQPHVGEVAYYQELYKGEAEDLGRDLRLDGQASVAGRDYSDLLVVEEWNKLQPEAIELKYYAAGIGVVMEEMTRGGSEIVELIGFSTP
jgi:hypothetical protein